MLLLVRASVIIIIITVIISILVPLAAFYWQRNRWPRMILKDDFELEFVSDRYVMGLLGFWQGAFELRAFDWRCNKREKAVDRGAIDGGGGFAP